EVPDQLAGVGVQRQRRVGVEDVAVTRATDDLGVRDGHAGAVVDEAQFRVVRAGGPRGRTPAALGRHAVPRGLDLGVVRVDERVEAPQLLTAVRVVGRDEAAAGRAGDAAARGADDDLVVGDQGTGREAVALLPVVYLDLPLDLAGEGVERDELGVDRREDDVVTPERDGVLLARRLVVVVTA